MAFAFLAVGAALCSDTIIAEVRKSPGAWRRNTTAGLAIISVIFLIVAAILLVTQSSREIGGIFAGLLGLGWSLGRVIYFSLFPLGILQFVLPRPHQTYTPARRR